MTLQRGRLGVLHPSGYGTAAAAPQGNRHECLIIPFPIDRKPGANLFIQKMPIHSMTKKDALARRQLALALSSFKANRQSLIDFHKGLAQVGKGKPINDALRAKDADSTVLDTAQALLDLKIIEFAKALPTLQGAPLDEAVLCLSFALFLMERTRKIRVMALAKDDLGIYPVYAALRDGVCDVLKLDYYSRGREGVFEAHAALEPLIMAASELCGLKTPDLKGIAVDYKPRLAKAAGSHYA